MSILVKIQSEAPPQFQAFGNSGPSLKIRIENAVMVGVVKDLHDKQHVADEDFDVILGVVVLPEEMKGWEVEPIIGEYGSDIDELYATRVNPRVP